MKDGRYRFKIILVFLADRAVSSCDASLMKTLDLDTDGALNFEDSDVDETVQLSFCDLTASLDS